MKGCWILAEMTTWNAFKRFALLGCKFLKKLAPYEQLNQNDWNSFVFACRWVRRGAIVVEVYARGTVWVKIGILKGKGLNLRAEPPLIKLYWATPSPGGADYVHCPCLELWLVHFAACVGCVIPLFWLYDNQWKLFSYLNIITVLTGWQYTIRWLNSKPPWT